VSFQGSREAPFLLTRINSGDKARQRTSKIPSPNIAVIALDKLLTVLDYPVVQAPVIVAAKHIDPTAHTA
jgi:hypothetical protein